MNFVDQIGTEEEVAKVGYNPLLSIPIHVEQWNTFSERLGRLLREDTTHVYIDTSFLMWMTKIGSVSRKQLTDWFKINCDGRVHVPVWSAHEYLKHHVSETIVVELAQRTKEIRRIAARTYAYFRPFMDEPLGEGREDPMALRAEARVSLNALEDLAQNISKWTKSYQKHAWEVIGFINNTTPVHTTIFEQFEEIMTLGEARFSGSVPPGHKDRWKADHKTRIDQSGYADSTHGNPYGDLVFWREMLAHAKTVAAVTLLVITNDRKNDWYFVGRKHASPDESLRLLKRDWKPMPRPHPLLVMEARLVANVKQVELLDSAYLAAILHENPGNDVRAFADVAIVPDETLGRYDASDGEGARSDAQPIVGPEVREDSAEGEYLVAESQTVRNTRNHFMLALLSSRNEIDNEAEAVLVGWSRNVGEDRKLVDIIDADTFDQFDQRRLATFARELHDRALEKMAGYGEVAADVVAILDKLPTNIAASLYLGLLASMYLTRETNTSRIPPSSFVATSLFERQSKGYAVNGIYAVAKRVRDNERAPLYVPSMGKPPVQFVLDIETDSATRDELRSITLNDVELLIPAQSAEDMRLSSLFQEDTRGQTIIRKACELYGVPFAQVERTDLFDIQYTFSATGGFKPASEVAVPKDENND